MQVMAAISVARAMAGNGCAFPLVAADELGRDMRGIGRAAAVAEQQDFVSFPERPGHELRDLHDTVGMLAHELLLDGRAVVKRLRTNSLMEAEF